jgi:hypothetical protein
MFCSSNGSVCNSLSTKFYFFTFYNTSRKVYGSSKVLTKVWNLLRFDLQFINNTLSLRSCSSRFSKFFSNLSYLTVYLNSLSTFLMSNNL